jgi:hypothetical protein
MASEEEVEDFTLPDLSFCPLDEVDLSEIPPTTLDKILKEVVNGPHVIAHHHYYIVPGPKEGDQS